MPTIAFRGGGYRATPARLLLIVRWGLCARSGLPESRLGEVSPGRLQLADVEKGRSCQEQDEGKDSPFGEGGDWLGCRSAQ